MISLVGYTGFVGGNLASAGSFDGLYNTKNIEDAFGTHPEILVYAGLRAEKFLAQKDPERDRNSILEAQENIRRIAPGKLILISTIEVYEDPFHAVEKTAATGQGAYGKNRTFMEEWVKENYSDCLIVRLPGLFGPGIRKNFIYDYIHYVPALLNEEKFQELSAKEPELRNWYAINDRGFYQLKETSEEEHKMLRSLFEKLQFSALNFTDSRGVFQYYNLEHLYDDISAALDNNINVLNIATEPVSVGEIYAYLTGERFVNEISAVIPDYDFRTLYFRELGGFPAPDGKGGYLYRKEEVLKEIQQFTDKEMQI